jgi:6-phosphogluconolactonase
MIKNSFAFSILFLLALTISAKQNKTFMYIGTYTDGKPDSGIHIFKFNNKSGAITRIGYSGNTISPSFLTISPNNQYLYACTETNMPQPGNISAFKIDTKTGLLTFINKQNSGGKNPAYLKVHQNNKMLITGNYSSGSVAVLTTNDDGSLNPYTQNIVFTDSSINKKRQNNAHIHASVFSPDYNYAFLPDLGADKIRVFKFDASLTSPLIDEGLTIKTTPGSGPRHFTFHPNQQFAYLIEELAGSVSAYKYKNGQLEPIQRIFSYSKTQESYGSADIHISPDGKFLYTSNRWDNENTITIFSINQQNGMLQLIGHQSTFGDHPRNFAIDPSGNFLIVANLYSNNIVIFKRNKKNGLLTKTKFEIIVNKPSCVILKSF